MRLNFHTIFFIILITSCTKNENTNEEINCEGEFSTSNVLTNIDEEIYMMMNRSMLIADIHGLQKEQLEFCQEMDYLTMRLALSQIPTIQTL